MAAPAGGAGGGARGEAMSAAEHAEALHRRGLDDLSSYAKDELASDMDAFLGEGGVFAKAKTVKFFDGVWQEDPLRMVKYRPSILHAYGWLPGLIWRNMKGTVFADGYLGFQVISMSAWVVFLEATAGYWTSDADVQSFIKFFGTPYMGAVVNLCMLITFILGLFVTLVVNRWWEVRVQYGMVRALSIEVSHIIVANMRGTKAARTDEERADAEAQNARARSEMIRYLNFAHLLLLTDAQSKEHADFTDSPLEKAAKWARRQFARVPVLRHFLRLEEVNTQLGDVLGSPTRLMASLRDASVAAIKGAAEAFSDIGRALKGEELHDVVDLQELTAAELKERDFQSYFKMGLVTQEEWELIKQQEEDGVQSWRTVYTWAAALLAEAVAAGRMEDRLGPAASLHAMLLEIRNAGGRIFTMMGSQLPYTYVHLVSFVCHVFLWVLASYFGFILHSGIPQVHYDLVLHETGHTGVEILGDVSSKRSGSMAAIDDNWWLFRLQVYIFITFSNTLVQGLLSMHGLLENPFGVHPCKFPLRSYAIDHIRQTRAMLKDPAEREPEVMRRIFKQPPPPRDVSARRTGDLAKLAAEAAAAKQGGPEAAPGAPAMPDAANVSDAVAAAMRRQAEKDKAAQEDEGGSML